MAFKLAQTFYIDSASVQNAEHVTISSINLYFKQKPLATSNRSGINSPGVNIYLMETRDDDVPNVAAPIATGSSRLEYNSIVASTDASIPATFLFARPVIVQTNKSYALCVAYDGDEDYSLWTCREGELVVGTNTTTSGSTARNVGNYYEYSSLINSTGAVGTTLSDQWKSLSNVDLKFSIKVGVYSDSVNDSDISTTYILPSDPAEYLAYDRYHFRTLGRSNLTVGEMVFQETPVSFGSINVSAANLNITATGNINFTNLLAVSGDIDSGPATDSPTISQKSYIVIRNGSGISANVNIREVVNIVSNTQIVVDRFPTFTNPSATFSVTAVGKLTYQDFHWYNGRWWNGTSMDQLVGRKVDVLRLTGTNANSSVRFSNNGVVQVTINSGGQKYSNNDTIVISPNITTADPTNINYIPSYANAVASIVTNGAGTITGISFSNAGFGMTSSVVTTINTTNGVSANLFVEMGSLLRSETSNATFGNTAVMNIDIHRNYPHCVINTNQHNQYRLFQHYPYYVKPGYEHLLQQATPAMVMEVDTFTNNDAVDLQTNDGRTYVLASRSNEVQMQSNVVLQVANSAIVNTAFLASSVLEVSINSNNAFSLPMVTTDDVYNYRYIINNTHKGERKGNGQGTALARHISTKVTFASNRRAEDVVVYVDAYRPAGTTIYAYTRLYNSADPDAFDDKDWTRLQLTSNNSTTYSSMTNANDIIEYTFGLGTPASVNTIAGDVTTTLNSTTLSGTGSNYVQDLMVNDVVKLYSYLFPNNSFTTVVTSITDQTHITIADPIANNSFAGSGYKLDLIGRPAYGQVAEIGTPFQAFTNKNNNGICRYYNSSMAKFDTYNTFQVKLVLLSNNAAIVPRIEDTRAVGVSA